MLKSIPKYDGEGKVKGHELKHYVPLCCGLDNKQWNERNQSIRAITMSVPKRLQAQSAVLKFARSSLVA
jgi:hypothetical protein